MAEMMTCPERMNRPGPWERLEDLDCWDEDCWIQADSIRGRIRRIRQRAVNRWNQWKQDHGYTRRLRFIGADQGLWHGDRIPRTCSFCGGLHPEDVIALLEEGWEVEPTGKTYKRYLHPHGYRETGGYPTFSWTPGPPAKVYTWHFSDDQRKRFNAALDAKKAKAPAA